jgi:hypothetical protein
MEDLLASMDEDREPGERDVPILSLGSSMKDANGPE